jgi:outer membrane lipase/esterase
MSSALNLRMVLVLGVASVAVVASAFDRVFTFGDSLSDTGNTFIASFGFAGGPPYWNGRFSNGPVWVEGFSADMGGAAVAHRLGGTNFAYGGAEANTGSALSTLLVPNVGTQIGLWQAAGNTFSATDLVVLWAGGNDFVTANSTNPLGVAANMATHMNTLYGLGARNFVLPNLPMLGYIPRYVGTANESVFNARSVTFNNALAGHAADLRARPGATVYEIDVASLFNEVRLNPGAYGFSNVTQGFLDAGGNVNDFMFFDDIHPTAAVHEILRQSATEAVPEPVSMVGLGVLAFVVARRRSRCA